MVLRKVALTKLFKKPFRMSEFFSASSELADTQLNVNQDAHNAFLIFSNSKKVERNAGLYFYVHAF